MILKLPFFSFLEFLFDFFTFKLSGLSKLSFSFSIWFSLTTFSFVFDLGFSSDFKTESDSCFFSGFTSFFDFGAAADPDLDTDTSAGFDFVIFLTFST